MPPRPPNHICAIVPPHILRAIAERGDPAQREAALATLTADAVMREQRQQVQTVMFAARAAVPPAATASPSRTIYDADSTAALPGRKVRGEGDAPTADISVNEAYDGLGATFDLYWNIFKRNSIDAAGLALDASVHYRQSYNNALWNGSQMLFGDGDRKVFDRFTKSIDIIGHELTHGVTGIELGLEYHDQPGALNESISDVFGSLVKQRQLGQDAATADWLIGEGLFMPGIQGRALRSMKAPGTAYNDPRLGKDPQPDHMRNYDPMTDDHGGVHINSGIPNKAFYLVATALGGNAWERAGSIWYATLADRALPATCEFQPFAKSTASNSGRLFDEEVRKAVVRAWEEVGVDAS